MKIEGEKNKHYVDQEIGIRVCRLGLERKIPTSSEGSDAASQCD